ncbi:MAG: hypothetical protein EA398_08995 [Deltaproteobacteria bacterium]|nr:MAG: hypothetical protein EA398_08995 [Deltaproteobacteria bacterium]
MSTPSPSLPPKRQDRFLKALGHGKAAGRWLHRALPGLALVLAACATSSPTSPPPPEGATAHFAIVEDATWLSGPDGTVPQAPDTRPMDAAREARLLARLQQLPFAVEYPFAGCQDRAHAAWLTLPGDLRRDVFKVWILGGSLLTIAFDGAIHPRQRPDVAWDFHVALAWKDTDGTTRVFDPVVLGPTPMALHRWLDALHIPPASVVLPLAPQYYAFHQVQRGQDAAFDKGRTPFNGSFYPYEGPLADENWIPHNLARDAVGAVLDHSSCTPLTHLEPRPADLGEALAELAQRGCSIDSACAELCQLYAERAALWTSLVHPRIASLDATDDAH